ncbi:mannose-1-phosphate guanylyltransferase [Lutibacter sp.]|uniref:mannose-1-phosphate guanylyltransferase n=1 Tax=Lutibacter sp. TaxID=1925666 RepID=UPI001A25C63B|nr:mannose-1-phosphate guanylyltransferase [Lutibacter sp.]MBI9042546.1 mannose-1-phosphate guanylyltransferase [Lutibacter sp.]
MNKNYYAVIMAGGIGSRFWPMSTKQYPKQFHDILGTGSSLIQQTCKRFEKIIPSDNILIATNKDYQALVQKHLPNIPVGNILLEPAMRNTAPCILYSALKIYDQNPDGIMIVAPSDHLIENETAFINNIETSLNFCSNNDVLVTLGIKPTFPNTGYGYIKYVNSEKNIKQVDSFTEKPNLEKANEFFNDGRYLWNAGIFVWSVKAIIKQFQLNLPKMFALFNSGNSDYNTTNEANFINSIYETSENISIDFGIMEKATNVFVIPATFNWNDLGTWLSLYENLDKDESENATVGGQVIYNNSNNNMVRTQTHKKVVIEGLSDFIVIEENDVLLICPKSKEQEIKEIRNQVKNKFGNDFV